MPCYAAMSEVPCTLSPDQTVEEALPLLTKHKTPTLPVIDEQGALVGIFSLKTLFKNILPVSVSMEDGTQIGLTVQAAPGIAKRLKKLEPLSIDTLIDRKLKTVSPDTPLWEGVNILIHETAPLYVLEAGTNKLMGVVSELSMLAELQRLKDSAQ